MSDRAFQIARQTILDPAGMGDGDIQKLLDSVMSRAVDAADIYFQYSRHESWTLEDGIVKDGGHGVDQGAGIRAVSGEKTGFAYSDEIILPALGKAADAARSIAAQGREGAVQAWRRAGETALYEPLDPLETLGDEEKVSLIQELDQQVRSLDPRVSQVIIRLVGVQDVVLVAAADGTFSADIRPLIRLNVSVIAEAGGRREQGFSGGGGRFGYEWLRQEDRCIEFGKEAVRQALVNLEAEDAPAGTMTVVLGPGWPGVLLHEAIGHGLEGDFNRRGTSAFSGRVGERVASPLCTVVDDGAMPYRRGSLNIDDEGTPTQCTTLIEDGILKGYMQDKTNARLMGTQSTGNGRRESFAHLPMPRMTNTYMLAGPHDPQEIVASVDKGLYASNFGGGQVDITSGKFVFSASEAYLIENGKVTRPVKGATLVGNGPDVLTRVSMVGTDLELDAGVGVCGKDGQSVPVGVGQPTLKVDGLTVGGTR